MYTISKRFEFAAAHRIDGLPHTHPCLRMHGHNYTVEVELQTPTLDAVGFVQDYGELGHVRELIDCIFEHRTLNDVLAEPTGDLDPYGVPRMHWINPTAENLAKWFYDQLIERYPKLTAVRVSETPKTWAEYRPTPGGTR